MPILLDNKILQATEAKMESALMPAVRGDYMKIVVAGGEAALHGGPNGLLARLRQSRDPVASCATGALNLVFLLRMQAKGTMPLQAMIPAAMTLMLQALDFADRMGIAKVGIGEVDRASHVFTNHLYKLLGVTPQRLSAMAAAVHGVMQDPTKMELIKRRAGVVKDPRASEPTMEAADGV